MCYLNVGVCFDLFNDYLLPKKKNHLNKVVSSFFSFVLVIVVENIRAFQAAWVWDKWFKIPKDADDCQLTWSCHFNWLINLYLTLCVWTFCMLVCVCLMPIEARRGHQITDGCEPLCVSTLNRWTVSLVSSFHLNKYTRGEKMAQWAVLIQVNAGWVWYPHLWVQDIWGTGQGIPGASWPVRSVCW